MVIDVFSIFGWIEPLKDKCSKTVALAFNKIFKSGCIPKMLWTDEGSEFYNKYVKDLFLKNDIKLYSTENEEKFSIVEGGNRTMKNKMWRMFSENNNAIYLPHGLGFLCSHRGSNLIFHAHCLLSKKAGLKQ